MASDHERELRQSCLAALEVMNKACESRDGSPVRIATIADVDYRVVFLALLKGAANGDPLAGSEQRGAAAKYAVGNANAVQRQAESQPSPPPQRGAASSTPHHHYEVDRSGPLPKEVIVSGPAVAAPSAVEEVQAQATGYWRNVISVELAIRHARELDALRPAKRRLEALENSVRFYVTDWCVKLIYERAAQIEKEAK